MEKEWLYINEFADAYGVHQDTIRRYIEMGKITTLERPTPHSRIRIPKAELERLLKEPLDIVTKDIAKERGQTPQPESKGQELTDPILLKVQQEHLDGIRNLIEGLKKVVYTVDIHHVYPSDWESGYYIEPIYQMEECNLFPCLKEHLPIPTLWHNYDEWRDKFFDYVEVCYKVIHDITREGEHLRSIDSNVLRILDGLEPFILDRIQYIDAWKGILMRPFDDWRDIIDCQAGKYKTRRFHFRTIKETGRQTLEAEGYRVLEAKDALAAIKPFQSFADNFLVGEDVTRLRTLYCELRDLERKIWKSLDEILIRHDYIKYTCKLCPRQ